MSKPAKPAKPAKAARTAKKTADRPDLAKVTDPVDPAGVFLSDAQLEARWGRKRGFCSELRSQGLGPRFTQISPRVTRYRLDDVLAYEQRHTYGSRAEAVAASTDDSPEAA